MDSRDTMLTTGYRTATSIDANVEGRDTKALIAALDAHIGGTALRIRLCDLRPVPPVRNGMSGARNSLAVTQQRTPSCDACWSTGAQPSRAD